MRIGVDYYPEHWDETRWSIDAKLMREAGIRVVRLAEFAWSRMEPSEGVFEFDWLERAIDVLHKEGIEVLLGTPTAAPPAWLHEKHPNIYPLDENRLPKGFGTRLQRCVNHPAMRNHSRTITREMAARFGSNPAVIGWQIDNELTANFCHCDICADHFRRWLAQKYGSLEGLNSAWGTVFWSQEYSSWSQVPLPWEPKCGRTAHNPSLLLDFRRFQSDSTISFAQEQTEIIRRLSPGKFITHNQMGTYDSSLDLHRLWSHMDFVSWDNYVWGHYGDFRSTACAHDAMRGVKQRNFWVMEQQSGITGWANISRRPHDGQLRCWVWQAIGHGADTVLFFRWRSCLFGTEQYWHGILNHDGLPRRRYKLVADLSKEIEALSEIDGSTVVNDVAILNSYEQNWALQIQPQTSGLDWWTQISRYHGALARAGVGVDVVSIAADLDHYKLVVLPSWYILTESDAQKIADYVRNGGTIVLSPRTGVKNAENTCRDLPLPSLLSEVAGLEVDEYDALGGCEGEIRTNDGRQFPISVWADALLLRSARPLAAYSQPLFEGESAIARNAYGKGECYYLGMYSTEGFYDYFFASLLDRLEVRRIKDLPAGVDVCQRRKDDTEYVFVVNLTRDPKQISMGEGAAGVLGPELLEGVAHIPPFGVGIYRTAVTRVSKQSLVLAEGSQVQRA